MSKIVLGIDVGGTKIASGLIDAKGRTTAIKVVPTSKSGLTAQIVKIAESYSGFQAIGLGVPGQVTPSGMVAHLPNLKNFKPVNLKKLLASKFKLPVMVNNDADCFAYAQAVLGEGKKHRVVAGLILGTGIGLGLVINKQIYTGSSGVAGEIGHMLMLDGNTLEAHVQDSDYFRKSTNAKKFLKVIASIVVLGFNPDLIVVGGFWSRQRGVLNLLQKSVAQVAGYEVRTKVVTSKIKHPELVGAAMPAFDA